MCPRNRIKPRTTSSELGMFGYLFETGRERVGVRGSHRGERLQDDQVEGALKELANS